MRFLLFFILSLSLFHIAAAQKNKDDAKIAAAFDNYIIQSMPQWKTPGLSVAVVKDGKVVFKKGYGLRELGKPQPFTTATLSACASTTKAMTAACMGMLVDEGKLKWKDKVADILPAFKLANPTALQKLLFLTCLRTMPDWAMQTTYGYPVIPGMRSCKGCNQWSLLIRCVLLLFIRT